MITKNNNANNLHNPLTNYFVFFLIRIVIIALKTP